MRTVRDQLGVTWMCWDDPLTDAQRSEPITALLH